jgi:hypothetical protein
MQKKPSTPFFYQLGVTCLGIIAYGVIFSKNDVSNISYLVGYSLLPAIIVSAIFLMALARGCSSSKKAICFILVYISFFLCFEAAYYKKLYQCRGALHSIQSSYDSAVQNTGYLRKLANDDGKVVQTSPGSTGEVGTLASFIKECINKFASINTQYYKELKSTGFKDVLNWDRIQNDQGLALSDNILLNAQSCVQKYKALSLQALASTRTQISNLPVSDEVKTEMLRSFDQSIGTSSPCAAFWENQIAVVESVIKIIQLLKTSRGTWYISGGNIKFTDDSNLALFNKAVDDYNLCLDQEEQMVKAAHDRVESTIKGTLNKLN